jgi:hypothetical protein
MISSPNKNAAGGLSLGSKLDFFTIESTVPFATGTNAAQGLLNTLIETISLNGQPVISAVLTQAAASATQLTGATSVLKFAVEHTGAWTELSLAAAISAITFDAYTTVAGNDPTTLTADAANLDTTTTTTEVDVIAGVTAPAVPYAGAVTGVLATLVAISGTVPPSTLPTGLNVVVTLNTL